MHVCVSIRPIKDLYSVIVYGTYLSHDIIFYLP